MEVVTCLVLAKCSELAINKNAMSSGSKPHYMDNQHLFVTVVISVVPAECGQLILHLATSEHMCSVLITVQKSNLLW